MDSTPVIVKYRVVGTARLLRIDSGQLSVPAIGLRILIIQTAQPDPVVFRSDRRYIAKRFSDMKTKTAGRSPVGNIRESAGIPTLDADLPFVPRLGRKRIRIIQKFVVLRESPGRNKRRVPDIITAAHALGIRI